MRVTKQSGFSLLEMVVVVAIMSIIVGAAIPVTSKVMTYQARKATREELGALSDAVAEYVRDTLAHPSSIADLVIDPSVSGWSGPYLPGVVDDSLSGKIGYEVDAWSRDYSLSSSGDVLTISSQGEDGTAGNSDDLEIEIDASPLRRAETRDRLMTVNNAVLRYNTEKDESDPALVTNWSSARSTLISQGYLPDDGRYQVDAWGDDLVEDPVGDLPVVMIGSVNLGVASGGGSGGGSKGKSKGKGKGKGKGN